MPPRLSRKTALRILVLAAAATLAIVSVASSLGSGPSATSSSLGRPTAAAPVPAAQGGGFLIADMLNHVVRRVDAGGHITTVAGTGTAGDLGDGGPATAAEIDSPTDAVPTADGGFLIAQSSIFGPGTGEIRKVAADGTITTVAGGGASDCNGCPATSAQLDEPTSAVPLSGGGFLIADYGANDVRKVDSTGTITLVAGTVASNPPACSGQIDAIHDGCQATEAALGSPTAAIPFSIGGADVSTTGAGFLITEEQGCRVRYVDGSGVIGTVAGSTSASSPCRTSGDPAPPAGGNATTDLKLTVPTDARPVSDHQFLVADAGSCAVRLVDKTAGTYTTPAQSSACTAGQGNGLGLTAAIPRAGGDSLLADSNSAQVYDATPAGALTAVAGTGTSGFNSVPPSISGAPSVGSTLSCSNGSWSRPIASYAHQWNRDGAGIPGATGSSYGVATVDGGHGISCTVTATASSGSPAPQSSATSETVTIGSGGSAPPPSSPSPPPPATTPKPPVCHASLKSATVLLRKAKKSSAPAKALTVSVTCDKAAQVSIGASVTAKAKRKKAKKIKVASRAATVTAGKAATVVLKLPSSAISALKKRSAVSVVLTLGAKGAGGTSTATSPTRKLKLKR